MTTEMTNQLKQTSKDNNTTSTDVTSGGAWYNKVAAKQSDSLSTVSADKQINKDMLQLP